MPRRVKEEERIERIIQGLLKLPENRRCINCTSLGPQYVCTTFWTFICSTCSGVHRGFTHRVKSVSAAKFNAEEVDSLQAGGNERAREIYLKLWNPHSNSFPDGRNIPRLREFIKHVYVDRRYAGGRNFDNQSTLKLANRDDSNNRYSSEYTQGSKDEYNGRRTFEKSSSSGKNEVRTLKYFIEDNNSPRNKPETMRSISQRNRRTFFEIVDDRVRFSNTEVGPTSENPNTPVVRPLKEILGENIPPLKVGKILPPDNHRKDGNSGADTGAQKKESVEEKAAESKTELPISLIDFSTEPEVSETAIVQEAQQMVQQVDAGNSTESSKAQNANSVESLLFDLSALAVVPSSTTSEAHNITSDVSLSNGVGDTLNESTANSSSSNCNNEILALPSCTEAYNTTQQHNISFYNQPWSLSAAPNPQEPAASNSSSDKSSEATNSADVAKSIDQRKELPMDLFSLGYSSYTAPVPSWQFRPSQGLGYNMQYNPHAMPLSAFPNSARSTNPFDLGNESTHTQTPTFPPQPQPSTMSQQSGPYGMAPPQGAYMGQQLLNMPHPRPQRTNSADEAAFASLNPLHKSNTALAPSNGPNSFSQVGGNPFG